MHLQLMTTITPGAPIPLGKRIGEVVITRHQEVKDWGEAFNLVFHLLPNLHPTRDRVWLIHGKDLLDSFEELRYRFGRG